MSVRCSLENRLAYTKKAAHLKQSAVEKSLSADQKIRQVENISMYIWETWIRKSDHYKLLQVAQALYFEIYEHLKWRFKYQPAYGQFTISIEHVEPNNF